jgi:hypothetical protein
MKAQRIVGLDGSSRYTVACMVKDELVVIRECETPQHAEKFVTDMAVLSQFSAEQKDAVLAMFLHAAETAKLHAIKIENANEDVGKPGYATKSHMAEWAYEIGSEIDRALGAFDHMIWVVKGRPGMPKFDDPK